MLSKEMEAVAGLINGLEIAIFHVFDALHRRKVVTRDESILMLIGSADRFEEPTSFAPAAVVLRRIATMLLAQANASREGSRPADIRHLLRVIEGGLHEAPPPDQD